MRGLLVLALMFAAGTSAAQVPIAEVLVDADGDRVPDQIGQTVTVAGRAPADEGAFGENGSPLYLQDGTGGLALRFADGFAFHRPVLAGDSLLATGTIEFYAGVPFLTVESGQHMGVGTPAAARVYDATAHDAMEGQLVEAEGTVVGISQVPVGQALMLSLDDLSLVVVFAFDGLRDPVSYEDLHPGDRVRVVGIAGQYDHSAPYSDSHQIYPRSQAGLMPVGLSRSEVRLAALAVLLVLLGALVLAAWFRIQVRRRVAALRASENRYQILVERAADAVFLHDLDGRNVELNASARDLLGLDEAGGISSMLDVVAPRDLAQARSHAEAVTGTGNSRVDLHIVTPDGREQLLEFESQRIELEGTVRVLSLGRDVRARRAYERGLVDARERAEEAMQAKSAFLASMSHEIRTPLTAVIGFAEILQEEVGDEQRDLVGAIENGGRRLLMTLNSVLDLAALDARNEQLRPVSADVIREVEEVVRLLRPLARERGLWIDVDASLCTLPATVDIDALGRILTNLLGNAIKFTKEGGVTIEVDADADTIRLRVVDTGVGISEDFLPLLFSAFRQQSEGFGRSHEGSGLGLTITQRLVRLMGGTITVESELGAGTAFAVSIPRHAATAVGDRHTSVLPEAVL